MQGNSADSGRPSRVATVTSRLGLGVLAASVLAGTARAHSGSLGGAAASATVPTWLTVLTGGIVVGATFLFTTLLTDHEAMRNVNWWRTVVPAPATGKRVVGWALRVVAVVALALVLVVGFTGPRTPTRLPNLWPGRDGAPWGSCWTDVSWLPCQDPNGHAPGLPS